jgi:integrase
LTTLEAKATDYAAQSRSENTRRAYGSDWRSFSTWCAERGLDAVPTAPSTIALYLTDQASRLKTATLRRRLSSIAVAHRVAGVQDPTKDVRVQLTWAGIRRVHGVAQRGKDALSTDDLRAMIATLPGSLIGARDRCLLLLGYTAALRRSELVGLDVADLEHTSEGLILSIRRSKTDQEGTGREIGVPYGSNELTCPVNATLAWLEASAITTGPLLRSVNRHGRVGAERLSDGAIALVVKRSAEAVGLDPARFAGHSLRSGMATSAARAGATEAEIANQTGHRSVAVLRRYIRRGSLFEQNAAVRLGL